MKEFNMDVQYIMNVLSSHGEQKAIEAFENIIETLKADPQPMSEPRSAEDVSLGKPIYRLAELRYLLEGLNDNDLLTLVQCDEHGDEQDHYPMSIDVIENIKLTDGTNVREIQFVQHPNSEPDTRDKQKIVDALIDVLADDIAKGDTTVLDELLLRFPYDVLKYALPEDMWADFQDNN